MGPIPLAACLTCILNHGDAILRSHCTICQKTEGNFMSSHAVFDEDKACRSDLILGHPLDRGAELARNNSGCRTM
jgi:hypothetical protein